MNFKYIPPDKAFIDEVAVTFKESRDLIRAKLGGKHSPDDQVIESVTPDSEPISLRRDIYEDLQPSGDLFFLNYNEHDQLGEIEVHRCKQIQVFDTSFDFDDKLDLIAGELSKYAAISKSGEGAYFFRDLKISIIDEEHMGGEGGNLGYFYCASDVSHLED
jgi:hypothetical protein